MIINSQIKNQVNVDQTYPENKANQLKFDLLETKKRLVLAKDTFKDLDQQNTAIENEIDQMLLLLKQLKRELEEGSLDTLAKNESIEKALILAVAAGTLHAQNKINFNFNSLKKITNKIIQKNEKLHV